MGISCFIQPQEATAKEVLTRFFTRTADAAGLRRVRLSVNLRYRLAVVLAQVHGQNVGRHAGIDHSFSPEKVGCVEQPTKAARLRRSDAMAPALVRVQLEMDACLLRPVT